MRYFSYSSDQAGLTLGLRKYQFYLKHIIISVLLLLCLEDDSALEVSPVFYFFTGFSGATCFFPLSLKESKNMVKIA